MGHVTSGTPVKRIAAITTVRNDTMFLERWARYYGDQLGAKNIYIFLDGHDQILPQSIQGVNALYLPHLPLKRGLSDRRRAKVMSDLARSLFSVFDAVIVTDVDEFIVVDPRLELSLAEFLSQIESRTSVSALGLDVGQHLELESPINSNEPFLDQRKYAHLSSRYTKPSIAFKPITWGSGMHRIKGRNFHIDPNLFLFHFGMVDYQLATNKTSDKDRISTGWKGHLTRREKLFKIITESKPLDGDDYFDEARHYQTWHRPIYALNKPGMIPSDPVVRIPRRFRGIV